MAQPEQVTEERAEAVEVEEQAPLERILDKVKATVTAEKIDANQFIDRNKIFNTGDVIAAGLKSLFDQFAEQRPEVVDAKAIDTHITEIDKKLTAQINAILHDETFQALESSWTGLKQLVDNTNFRRAPIQIDIFNISKESLRDDFKYSPDLLESGLYKQIYTSAYDLAGGSPFSAMIGNYEFKNSPQDIGLLQNLSKVAASCHCPFIGSVGPEFFGYESIGEITIDSNLSTRMKRAEFIPWNSLRDTEDARWLGLTLPHVLLRLPYGKDTIPVESFDFEEDTSKHENYLWGSSALAMASNMVRAFTLYGWCAQIRGPQAGGKVEGLPLHLYEEGGVQRIKIPTEALISDQKELELSELGFIPLLAYENQDYASFFSANSIQRPKEYVGDEVSTANSRISARLPYLFISSRIAHYLKVMQRDNIGTTKEAGVLQGELQKWINEYVNAATSASQAVIARKPLREAQITVEPIAENPGYFRVQMSIIPHFQVEGIDVSLSLVSQMPTGD
jgi:type VI secretion system protein ImpC